MNVLKSCNNLLPKVSLYKPSKTNRTITLQLYNWNVSEKLQKLNNKFMQTTGEEYIDYHLFDKKINDYNRKINNLIQHNKGSPEFVLTKPKGQLVITNSSDLYGINFVPFNMSDEINQKVADLIKNIWPVQQYQDYCEFLRTNETTPDWIYISNPNIPQHLIPICNQWKSIVGDNLNFNPLFKTIPDYLTNFSLDDKSLYFYSKILEIDNYANCINYLIENAETRCNQEIKKLEMKESLDKCNGNVIDYLTKNNYDMSYVFCDDSSGRMLNNMIKAINEIDGAKEWLLNTYVNIYESNDKIMEKIQSHPDVIDDGHSGTSAAWALQNVKSYYISGPEKYCQGVLQYNHIL